MPDPAPARRFKRDLIHLERSILTPTRAAMGETRLKLLEALLNLGVASTSLPSAIRVEMDTLARRVAVIGQSVAPVVQMASADLARSQLEILRNAPPFEQAQTASTAQRAEIARLLESAAWAAALSARLQSDLAQLRAGGEGTETAQEMLFNPGNRGGAWHSGETNMELVSQRNLWTVGVGLAAAYYIAAETLMRRPLYKQADAEIDGQTTDCCLAVAGQIQPLNDPFITTEEPAFASQQMHPPFHWNCRTLELLLSEPEEGGYDRSARLRADKEIRKGGG